MAALVTLAEAKNHLRLDGDFEDEFVELRAEMATDIVIDYIKRPEHEWTDADAPPLIKAAVLLMLGVLNEEREGATIPDGVKSILHRYRDPAIA